MKATRPSRARCSHGLRKRTRPSQLMILITTICICRAGLGGSTNALTFQLCRRNSNVTPLHVFTSRHVEDSSGSRLQHARPARIGRLDVLPLADRLSCGVLFPRRTRISRRPAQQPRPAAAPTRYGVSRRAKVGSHTLPSGSSFAPSGPPAAIVLSSTGAGGAGSGAHAYLESRLSF